MIKISRRGCYFDHILSDMCKREQIAPHDGIHKHASLFRCIPVGYVHRIRFHHHSTGTVGRSMERRDRSVIGEAVISSNHAEAQHVPLVVQNLQPLRARPGRQARNDADLAEAADVSVSVYDVAALEKVLVRLRFIETAHDGPHNGYRRVDGLDYGGEALVGSHGVGVVAGHGFRQGNGGGRRNDLSYEGRGGMLFLEIERGGGDWFCGIDSVELKRRRHINSSIFSLSLSLCLRSLALALALKVV